MTIRTFLLFSALAFATCLSDECPKGWVFSQKTSFCYTVSPTAMTFDEAVQYCPTIGGHLTSIYNTNEKTFLTNYTANQMYPPWVGTKRNSTTKTFVNIDGSYLSTSYWQPGQPGVNGDCAVFISADPAGMQVVPCYSLQPAVCRQKPALCVPQTVYGGPNVRSGTIQSPGYPVQYYNNLNCQYTIVSPNNTYITINFDPWFVEEMFDYIKVYDGNMTSSPIAYIESYWDRRTLESTTNSMTVIFKSDSIHTDKGWLGTWSAKANTPPIRQSGTNGTMTSPNYPSDYAPYTEQLYYISGISGFKVNITIDDFNTENNYDRLEIYNSTIISKYSLVANLSGPSVAPYSYLTPYNYATLRFTSDGVIQKKGWHLNWFIQ